MEPILIVLIVVAVLGVAAAVLLVRRSDRGEALEPPPSAVRPPHAVGTEALPADELDEPEIEIVDPISRILPEQVVITGPDLTPEEEAENIAAAEAAELDGELEALVEAEKPTFRGRLSRARSAFSGYVGSVLSRSTIDAESWDELEEALIRADVGIGPAQELLDAVRSTVKERGITSSAELIEAVKDEMKSRLAGPVDLARSEQAPTIWLFVGVNGVGKTTTIGKVGKRLTDAGDTVVMAAGDTFRAAAAEQL
ncbi:MAG: signal recognition particle receptor subunit alpha, partial [Microthrixaceae bacterium]